MSMGLLHSNLSNSTELVPVWKVYGFQQKNDGAAKDLSEFQQQMKQKQMFCIYTNQVSPFKGPSDPINKCDNQLKKSTVHQMTCNRRLMHRTRSALI